MRRDSVLTWLVEQGSRGAGEQGSILAEGILWFPATTLEKIALEIEASVMTVRRDIKDLKRRGVVVNKRRFRGVQLGLVVGKVSVQNEHLQSDSKCSKRTLTQPLISSSSSFTKLLSDNLTEGRGIDRGSGGKERRPQSDPAEGCRSLGRKNKKPKMQFVDLAMMAGTAAGWNDLEALPRNGFGLCLQERTGVDISRILSIRTSIEPRTSWPCAAIVKAARDWTGRDQTGRPLRDPGDWLYQQAFYIATEGMHSEWEAYSLERDKRMAEARGPEAVQVQDLLDGLAGKMRMPDSRATGMSPEARAAWNEERDKP